jgi:hypothetical protein
MALRLLIILLLTLQLTDDAHACQPLMQSLVQQAESTGLYGSWDACCARTGNDCYLTQQFAPQGSEPCDAAHSARAGCNRVPEGTVCMISKDDLIPDSPCSASIIRTCGTSLTMVLDGVAGPFIGFQSENITPALILSNGILGTQLCCSTDFCLPVAGVPSTSCTYSMTCVTDGSNVICVPFDQPNATTYAIEIVNQCNESAPTTTTTKTAPTSTPTSARSKPPINKGAVIGGVIGGVVGLLIVLGICSGACKKSERGGNAGAAGRGNAAAGNAGSGGRSYSGPLTEVDQATFSNSMRHIHRIIISTLTQDSLPSSSSENVHKFLETTH